MVLISFILFSCKDDEEITKEPVSNEYVKTAKEILKDSVVLSARAMMGTVNKTLLECGCPVKYFFEWRNNDTLNIQIRSFTVGNMPLRIWFSCSTKIMKLNTWEKDEYPGSGWIKFKGTGGVTDINSLQNDFEKGTEGPGIVIGYFNVYTDSIEFITDFNVENMTTEVYLQEIDTTRMATYKEDFASYEDSLAAYKKEHGL